MFFSIILIKRFFLSGSHPPQQSGSGNSSNILPQNQSHKNYLRRLKQQKLRDAYRQRNQSETGNNLLIIITYY